MSSYSCVRFILSNAHPDGTVGPAGECRFRIKGGLRRRFDTELADNRRESDRQFRQRELATDRQREVLELAYERGYYDRPSRTSHEALAAELGCAASTVGEHLRKAERRLVAAAIESGT